jgi:ABC-type sugar transport system substrate-binding protein
VDSRPNFPEAIVAVAFFGLLAFCLWLAVDRYDEFNNAWGLVAPLVGVVIGAIPSYFFHSRATAAEERAEKKQVQVDTLLQRTEPEVAEQARAAAPSAWAP